VLPLVEPSGTPGECLVTFCWRDDEAAEVLLFANRITDETRLEASLLSRLAGTDLWHVTYRLAGDWRASYAFLSRRAGERAPWLGEGDQVAIRAALDRGRPDPRNPDTCRNRAGVVQSVVALPGAPAQPWLARRDDVPAGPVVEDLLPDGRRAWLHDPSDVPADVALPALVVLDGEVWVGTQDLPTTLDNLRADGLVPGFRTVFVESGGRERRWAELTAGGDGVRLVVDAVLPWLRARRCVLADPRTVAVAGQSLGGLTALRAGLEEPGRVGNVLSLSASVWQDPLLDLVRDHAGHGDDLWVHLGHGRQEWVLAPGHRDLARALAERGIPVEVAEYNGGHDYAWWRGAVADSLVALARRRGFTHQPSRS
jgi:enterochelin esterase family protein